MIKVNENSESVTPNHLAVGKEQVSEPERTFSDLTVTGSVTNQVTTENKFFKSKREQWIFIAFVIPPLAISFISMLHMVTLFEASNNFWMSLAVAISVELAAMSSLVALVTLRKLNKTTIWSIFLVLAMLQIVGNMYHTFVNMTPSSLKNILDLLALENNPWSLRAVMFLVGGILPVISLTFVKGLVDYFKE